MGWSELDDRRPSPPAATGETVERHSHLLSGTAGGVLI